MVGGAQLDRGAPVPYLRTAAGRHAQARVRRTETEKDIFHVRLRLDERYRRLNLHGLRAATEGDVEVLGDQLLLVERRHGQWTQGALTLAPFTVAMATETERAPRA